VTGKGIPRIVCCRGELGSGKTTYIQGVARGLGYTGRLLSPTYIIVRRYDIPDKESYLYHLDLYRLTTPEDALGVGFSEIIRDPNAFVLIEWPERLGELMPDSFCDLRFDVTGDTHTIEGTLHI